jgi:Zn-dependent protease/CBS domain-containing protein
MRESFRIGRIAGVSIGANWSLLVVAALLSVGLASGRFPSEAPGYSDAAYLVAGVATALLFLATVLAHELSHALQARREGQKVDGIVLWLMGGVTRIEGENPSPEAEFRVSGAGPLASLLIGIGFGIIAFVLDASGTAPLVVAVARWLALINVVLAFFNVLPGAPLDGGRLLHAYLWRRYGDRLRATRAATRAGRALGYLLIAVGFVEISIGTDSGGGLWLALLGWFLLGAARMEGEAAELRHALGDLRVRDVMTADPVVGPGWLTTRSFIDDYVMTHPHHGFPVRDWNGNLAGLVTLHRLRSVPADQRDSVRVIDVACPMSDVTVASPDEPLLDLMGRLEGCADGRALVMDGDELVGIVSPSDISRAARSQVR